MTTHQRPAYKSDISFCDVEPEPRPSYWLSLYKGKVLYSTTGQVSYDAAFRSALLWTSIKHADRHYKISHLADGFLVEETEHVISQKCQTRGCRFRSRHSYYVVDSQILRDERFRHSRSHKRISTGWKWWWSFEVVLIALIILLVAAIRGWS